MKQSSKHTGESLRARALEISAPLGALLLEASKLAATAQNGPHGRKRSGYGDGFWQYRPAQNGDSLRQIDWRQSAKSDAHFVRETELQSAQSLMIWVEASAGMTFHSAPNLPSKLRRAQTLALAAAILANEAEESFGLIEEARQPSKGKAHLLACAQGLMKQVGKTDSTAPQVQRLPKGARSLIVSDFMADPAPIAHLLQTAAQAQSKGVLLQVLDPSEEAFPYQGRVSFQSISGSIGFESLEAASLQKHYKERLAARREALQALCSSVGWHFMVHHTNKHAGETLQQLMRKLEAPR